uniref:TBC1 domain family, member 2B n=1 Tax=Mus musculus TaxID=10090 RepID=F6W2R3_MOUSE
MPGAGDGVEESCSGESPGRSAARPPGHRRRLLQLPGPR